MLRNLLPRDTRAVEIASAAGLLFASFSFSLGNGQPELLAVHPWQFWVLLTAILGLLQTTALLAHPRLDLLRSVLAWAGGTWWLYLALSIGLFTPDDAVLLTVGIGNLYGFIINSNIAMELRRKGAQHGSNS